MVSIAEMQFFNRAFRTTGVNCLRLLCQCFSFNQPVIKKKINQTDPILKAPLKIALGRLVLTARGANKLSKTPTTWYTSCGDHVLFAEYSYQVLQRSKEIGLRS